MKRKKIIFLDIDGPMNSLFNIHMQNSLGMPTAGEYIQIPAKALKRLKRIVVATDALIVISSSWKGDSTIANPNPLMINFIKQIRRYKLSIYDYTPYIPSNDERRGKEISAWLKEFEEEEGYFPSYVVIDDDSFDLTDHTPRLVKVSGYTGISNVDCDKAVYILNNL